MTKKVHIGGFSLICFLRKRSLCLTVSVKEVVIKDDQKIINKIVYHVEKVDKKNNKITLVTLRFSIPEYKKLKNFDKLSETFVGLLHLINEYSKKRQA